MRSAVDHGRGRRSFGGWRDEWTPTLARRVAGPVAYAIVAWSFIIEILGASLGASRWLLDTSVLHHIARAPAADVRWDSAAILIAVGLAAALLGALAFARRDLEGA